MPFITSHYTDQHGNVHEVEASKSKWWIYDHVEAILKRHTALQERFNHALQHGI